jgi:predicted DNA-binding transcriptional regulator AlpA
MQAQAPRSPPDHEANSALITANSLAKLLGVSTRSVWRGEAAGLLPSPVRIGAIVRWRRSEVLEWIEAGCPERKLWERSRRSK